ncbi:unnamed protein product [Urochloa decumbens]|uniref:Uncharacterized protein n=1 Tax=Urochloa decumbens TaxID=240449 RepID=A0ABC8XYP3_9POAL
MAFTGISFIGNGTPLTQSASSISAARDDSAYHLLVVQGYSSTKKYTPNGKCIRSRRFRVGGYRWLIEYYPNGSLSEDPGCLSFYLYLDEDHAVEVPVEAEVQCRFGFVNQDVGKYYLGSEKRCYFSSHGCWRCLGVHRREDFELYHLKMSDNFTVRFDVKVTKKAVHNSAAVPFVVVPPPDIGKHLNGLLLSGDGADVTFEVNGEAFIAHRCVLASRSSVFKAELFGPMVEGTTSNVIRIDDIDAHVFKLLLAFIYSDSVPEEDEEEDKDMGVIWQHLLVAADRYDLQRLRLMCEVRLCRNINTTTVVPILVLAEQHYCRGLKEACLDFLSSPTNLQEVVADGVLDHLLISSCPSVLKELIVKLALKFDDNFGDASEAVLPLLEVPESDLHQHLSWLLKSEEGTDVTFQVGSETLSAHRCVLAARSTVFRAELFGQMKEDSTNSVIRIDDMEANVFRLLLTFIYSDSVPNMKEDEKEQLEKNEDDDSDVTWQQLLMAADRYDLQRMRIICQVSLCKCIRVTTVVKFLVLAEKHNYRWLKESCLDFLEIPANLQEVMAAGGLNNLSSCSSILIDLIAKLASLKRDN